MGSGRDDTRILGRWGEAKTADLLRSRGFRILASGFRSRFGEIDLIASDGTYLCFVEVKLRRTASFAQAREWVDARKQARIRLTAEHYLALCPSDLQPRFDVAEVYAPAGTSTREVQISYWEDAF